jgi:CsoR family transcriptional regulator, copper-sensing transcriptional repressor
MKGKIQKPYKKRATHRLKIIQGQIKGLERMVDSEDYCVEVLHQSLAIQESLKSFNTLMLENHLKTHVVDQLIGKDKEKGIKEMVRLYRLNSK